MSTQNSNYTLHSSPQGSLIANMIMGILILKKRYELSKYVSVLMITAGIVICTIVSGSDVVSITRIPANKTLKSNRST